jgi:hypothetical protein
MRKTVNNGAVKTSVYRRARKDRSEISPLIKYLLFIANVLLWVKLQNIVIFKKSFITKKPYIFSSLGFVCLELEFMLGLKKIHLQD